MKEPPAYTPRWYVLSYVLLLAAVMTLTALYLSSELRDLQRRVGQLESERR